MSKFNLQDVFNATRDCVGNKLFSASTGAGVVSVASIVVPACIKLLGPILVDIAGSASYSRPGNQEDLSYHFMIAGMLGTIASGVGIKVSSMISKDELEPQINVTNSLAGVVGAIAMTYAIISNVHSFNNMENYHPAPENPAISKPDGPK